MALDVEYIRAQFPALQIRVNDNAAAFFDGPGGTQVPQRVIDKMNDYLIHRNANTGGNFLTSERNDELILNARNTFADFFGCEWEEVSFCHNSTTISFKLSHAIARDLHPGDEVIITDIDHEANRGPWEILAERGIVIKSVKVDTETCTLDLDNYKNMLTEKTKVVAVNYASNAVGTINEVKTIADLARDVGAITIVDAVHYALHGVIDVKAIGADFLYCSAYKFFGPHLGVLYANKESTSAIRTLRVGAQAPTPPYMFEVGTLNHEGIAGAAEAVEFIADIGSRHPSQTKKVNLKNCSKRRKEVVAGMLAIEEHEKPLADYFKDELSKIDGLKLYGPPRDYPCTSTIAFRIDNLHPDKISAALGAKGIFTWAGNFYAVQLVKALGLNDKGGLVRIGLAPYNTKSEIDRTILEIQKIAS